MLPFGSFKCSLNVGSDQSDLVNEVGIEIFLKYILGEFPKNLKLLDVKFEKCLYMKNVIVNIVLIEC